MYLRKVHVGQEEGYWVEKHRFVLMMPPALTMALSPACEGKPVLMIH